MSWFRPVLVATVIALQGVPASAQNAAKPADPNKRVEIITSKLPVRGSKAYNKLLSLAGAQARGQILSHSKAEMWSMPAHRVDFVLKAAEAMGVHVVKLGPDWNMLLKRPVQNAGMTAAQEGMMNSAMRARETMSVKMMVTPDPALIEYALTKDIQGRAIGPPPPQNAVSSIIIPLTETEVITAKRTSIDVRENGYTWRGAIEGTGEPVMLMWWKGGNFNGMFTYRSRMYALKNMGGDVNAVVESDAAKMPPDHGAMKENMKPDMKPGDLMKDPLVKTGEGDLVRDRDRNNQQDLRDAVGGSKSAVKPKAPKADKVAMVPLPLAKRRELASKPVTIDLLVLYTEKAQKNYIDINLDLIALAIEQANAAFSNSGIGNVKLRVVHSQQVAYDEAQGEYFDHLYRMVDAKTGFEGVRALRNEKRADIVALVVDDPSGCGLSTRVAADADEAYAVVNHSCAALSYSLAHEIGHILGARHDRALDDNPSPFPYGHGFVNGTKWRDIMSYESSCNGCPRQPFWSTPTVNFMGDKAGSVDTDTARVILEQADRVSRFR